MKRFIAVFLSLVVCFSLVFSFPVSRVSASELTDFFSYDCPISKTDADKLLSDVRDNCFSKTDYQQYNDYILVGKIGKKIVFMAPSYKDSFVIAKYGNEDYLYFNGRTNLQLYYCDTDSNKYTFSSDSTCLYMVSRYYTGYSVYTSSRVDGFTFIPYYIDLFNPKELSFTVAPEITMNMNLSDVGGSVTVTATNDTDTAYDYIMYVSKSPSDIGVINSMYDTTYAASSVQWCYTKQTDATIPPDLKQTVKDKISDEFKTIDIMDIVTGPGAILYNIWGGSFKAAEQYFSYHEDHLTYYAKTQTNCPVYLINPHAAKEHTLYFSSFNINLNDTFYFNIIYKEHSSNVVSSVGASASALLSAAGGEYDAPIFNTQDFTSFRSYSSISFSVVDGYVPVTNKDDITGYPGITYYSNPDNSVANITNDNSVHINDSFNNTYVPGGDGSGTLNPSGTVINGVVVNGTAYFNYGNNNYPGVILPGGPSGPGSSAPSAPDFDFDTLKDGMGSFMDFLSWVGEHVPVVIVYLVSAGFAVAVYCRIWGR